MMRKCVEDFDFPFHVTFSTSRGCQASNQSKAKSQITIAAKFFEWASLDGLIAYTVDAAGLINQLLRRIALNKHS
jgi:hypothetical protein